MKYGIIRCACASPDVIVADCDKNADNIINSAKTAYLKGSKVIVFPELCITGYTCQDLFFQKSLQISAIKNLEKIAENTINIESLLLVGLPVAMSQGIYNCAAILFKGNLLALIAKSFLPNYGEFYERRHFIPFTNNLCTQVIDIGKWSGIPLGTNILIKDSNFNDFVLAAEICEDLWVPIPPSSRHILAGATIVANLSAGNEIIGKAAYRRNLVKSHSARSICAYLYANAGNGESTQDMVFASHNIISENGTILNESSLFSNETIYADVDLERLCQERRKTSSFGFSSNVNHEDDYLCISIDLFSEQSKNEGLLRFVDPHPFVPSDKKYRTQRCLEVITLQAQGLAKRLRHINCKSAVIGLSGGLDSTLALLVTCKAFDECGIDRKGITAITMPCFGTTNRTYNNACTLAKECRVTLKEIKIADSVNQHFKDIDQNPSIHDITYENCQARERTQVLMDYANKTNGIVIGTGDLSELALGWCTYNGDQMSMYGVNSSVPKTLVKYLVEWFAKEYDDSKNKAFSDVLIDILDTPVSPELLPPTEGKISQVTEDLVGPYELHDFFLYYLLRFGFSPSKILFLAENSGLNYTREFMIKWLKTFYKRFFSQQFKRSCMPDGAKVGTINLSPRGDWRMPSDASAAIWIKEVESLC